MSKLSSNLELKKVIELLQNHDEGFNLFSHKTIATRWELQYKKGSEIIDFYPLTATDGMKHIIDRRRLKAIANHFKVPVKIFYI